MLCCQILCDAEDSAEIPGDEVPVEPSQQKEQRQDVLVPGCLYAAGTLDSHEDRYPPC